MSAPKINYDNLSPPAAKNMRNPGYRRALRSLRALSDLRQIEADAREQAIGEQDGYLLNLANRMRAALDKFSN